MWTEKSSALLLQRLREIMGEEELAFFILLPQFEAVVEAVEYGWPFMLTKQPHGGYNVFVQKTPPGKNKK